MTTPLRLPRVALFATVAVLSGACRSAPESRPSDLIHLPYHVALAPLDDTLFGDPPTSESPEREIALKGYNEELTSALAEELEAALFSKVTPLGATDRLEDAARDEGADFLLRVVSVTQDEPLVTNWRGSNFWLYLAGPLVFTRPDRDFTLTCTLTVELIDLRPIERLAEASRVAQTPPSARFVANSKKVTTWFVDRVEGGPLAWVKTVIVPTGQLNKFGEKAKGNVAEKSLRSLARDLADTIARDPGSLLDPEPRSMDDPGQFALFDFAIAPDEQDERRLEFTASIRQDQFQAGRRFASVHLKDDKNVDLLAEYTEQFADDAQERALDERHGTDPSQRWKLVYGTVPLAAASVSETLQLEFRDDDGSLTRTRSWTFRLVDKDEAHAIEANFGRDTKSAPIQASYGRDTKSEPIAASFGRDTKSAPIEGGSRLEPSEER